VKVLIVSLLNDDALFCRTSQHVTNTDFTAAGILFLLTSCL